MRRCSSALVCAISMASCAASALVFFSSARVSSSCALSAAAQPVQLPLKVAVQETEEPSERPIAGANPLLTGDATSALSL